MARHPLALAVLTVLAVALVPATAGAQATPTPPGLTSCPTFRVLDNDPQAGYRAGTYDMQVWGNITCKRASAIFRNYLSRPQGLPSGWWVSPTQPAIVKGRNGRTGFSLSRVGRRTTPHTNGTVSTCSRTIQIQNPSPQAGYAAGTYSLQVFGTVSCNAGSAVLDDWLANPTITNLPQGWAPFADTPGFYYNRGAGGGVYVFKP